MTAVKALLSCQSAVGRQRSAVRIFNFLDLSQGITSPKGILYKKITAGTIASEYSNHKKGGNGYGQ